MRTFLEVSDLARAAGITPARVGQLVRDGQLRPWARTRRGVNLFRTGDLAAFLRTREADFTRLTTRVAARSRDS